MQQSEAIAIPQIQESEAWLTTTEAAELEGISRQAAHNKATSGKWIVKTEKIGRGGNGGQSFLVALSSLSAKARRKYYAQQGRLEAAATRLSLATAGQVPEDAGQEDRDEGDPINLAEVKALVGEKKFQELLAEAEEKLKPVLEFLELPDEPGRTSKAEAVAAKYDISLATLYRRLELYQKGGRAALMRRLPTLGRGTVRKAVTPEAERYARAEFLLPNKPKVSHVYKKVEKFCKANKLQVPSRATIYRVIKELKETEPDLVCLAREGEEEYARRYMVKATREEPKYANQVWEGDHHLMDVFVNWRGWAVRIWLTIWIDVATRVVVGFTLSVQANGQTIALALRHGILKKKLSGWDGGMSKAMTSAITNLGWGIEELQDSAGKELPFCGVPESLYIDNGRDYIAQVKKGTKSKDWEYSREVRSACDILQIAARFATAYSPWAKGHAERWFGTLTDQFTRFLPGYCGKDNKHRPHNLDEKKMAERGELLELEELYVLLEFFVHLYHNTVHSTLGMTPFEKYELTPKVREGLPEARVLDICLMDVEQAKVSPAGIQRFGTKNNRRWYTHRLLENYVGRQVVVRYDPNRIGELLVFDPKTGRYVCTATNKELLSWDASKDDIKEFIKQRAQRKKEVKTRLKEYQTCREDGLEAVVAQRQEGGRARIIGTTTDETDVRMITGMEEAARARETVAKPVDKPKKKQSSGRFDEFIRRAGSQG